jgi:hypothetical protein
MNRRQVLAAALAPGALPRTNMSFSGSRSEPNQPPAWPRTVLHTGSEAPEPDPVLLRAGPLSVLFEPHLAQVRFVRWHEREVLRAIYGAVRDRNWNTILPVVRGLRLEWSEEAFRATFEAVCQEGPIDYVWRGTIEGTAAGTLRFEFAGRANSSFQRNRIGVCVLHPVEGFAGSTVMVEDVRGRRSQALVPLAISPHQPFLEMRTITHNAAPGLHVEVRLEGDVFEMEDQRNWTDASFKTYSTPLALPFPVEVKSGDEVNQTVRVRLAGEGGSPPAARAASDSSVELVLEESSAVPLPGIGAVLAQESPELNPTEALLLRSAGLRHLRVGLNLDGEQWPGLLERALREAALLDASLVAAVTLGAKEEEQLRRLAQALAGKPRLDRLLVFHRGEKSTSREWVEMAATALRKASVHASVGAGTDAYFTELNRERPAADVLDFVSFSVNPQVHAFDNLSLVETLAMHKEVLESARRFCGERPLALSPVSFKPRFNPNATGAAAANPDRLPDSVDARQMSLFGAGWTLGSLKYSAMGRARWVDYYETTGWRGWMEAPGVNRPPALFRSQPGWVFPLYHVFRAVAGFPKAQIVPADSSDPYRVEGFALKIEKGRRLLLANLTGQAIVVRVNVGTARLPWRMRVLDENTAIAAMRNPDGFWKTQGRLIETDGRTLQTGMLPYSVAFLSQATA